MRETNNSSDEQELLRLYLRDIAKYPLLSRGEEKELGRRIRRGDEEALRRMVESNLRFVVSYAKRYRGLGVSYLDLIHEGNLGLVEAARRFDPSRDVRFLTYAGWWVRRSILTALRQGSEPRGPRFSPGLGGQTNLTLEPDERPDPKQGSPWATTHTESLSQPLGEEEDLEIMDRLADPTVPTPEQMLIRTDLTEHLKRLIEQLPERDSEVLKMRYGFHGEPPKTQQEIGDVLGLTRQRVQQIERAALSRLRRSDRARALRAFLN